MIHSHAGFDCEKCQAEREQWATARRIELLEQQQRDVIDASRAEKVELMTALQMLVSALAADSTP